MYIYIYIYIYIYTYTYTYIYKLLAFLPGLTRVRNQPELFSPFVINDLCCVCRCSAGGRLPAAG